ncbi:Chromosome partition protein Smc [Spiroplasma sp. JKS002669]|uniref:AAA family ATPase n=1 Tax=Spiroplasma attinicola TaxID=2904537 RepID=UPI0020BD7969|nr:AAA family ATPase [Spiroplasma sp. JKS002669]MCL6429076.1 Chromosome partition protein Smc [Spiroplasma sp. JKS002669]
MKVKYSIKRFRTIVDSQDIELDSNKINIILGVNGSGKSNILDAIRWFSGEDIKNIESKTTEFHPYFNPSNVFLDVPEIMYTDELDEGEKKYVLESLKEIKIKLFKNDNLCRYFVQYKDLYYKNLNVTKDGLTDLGRIKEAIVSKFKNSWPIGLFIQEEENDFKYWRFATSPESAKREIKRSKENDADKELLCKVIDVWINIENVFKTRPNILFSSNLEADNHILFEYPIFGVRNPETLNPTFRNILNMLGKTTITEIQKIIDLSSSTSNRPTIRALKNKMNQRFRDCFAQIFNNFTMDTIPEIVIDDNMFQIIINVNNNRHYASSETTYQSSGFKAFLWLIIMLEVIKFWDDTKLGRTILVVDEPDKSLHILLQYELAKYLETNFKNQNNVFILLTSHSPFLIPNLEENIYIAEMNKNGCTSIIKANDINDIRSNGIFPLITLFHMKKLKEELSIDLDKETIRIYYQDLNSDKNKKIEDFVKSIISKKIKYQLIPVTDKESKHFLKLGTNEFFSVHISKVKDLKDMIVNDFFKTKKDIYLTDSFIKPILSDDILDAMSN